jgi:hypothetical protein
VSSRVEVWQDAYGTCWELVETGLEGGCIIREGISSLDLLDGDAREGVDLVARFNDIEDARAFLLSEGFEPWV